MQLWSLQHIAKLTVNPNCNLCLCSMCEDSCHDGCQVGWSKMWTTLQLEEMG